MDLQEEIVSKLRERFKFKSEKGKWLQQGRCPECNQNELYCASVEPKVVRCGRADNCGYEDTVRNVLPELFEDWVKRAPPTDKCPTATADAYLGLERGLKFLDLRGHYEQEYYKDTKTGQGSTTIRFPIGPDGWWERLIDRPGRFDRKARFKPGGTFAGHCWTHPAAGIDVLAGKKQIWIAEGIFDAIALHQAGMPAVSAMTVNVWPEHFFDALAKAVREGPTPKEKPEIIFAFDVGKAGVKFTRTFVERARKEGWEARAAQVRPDGEGTKLDWNDLWLRHRDWNGEADKAPLGPKMIEEYLWNGDITIAESPQEKARLIHQRKGLATFPMRFDNRLYWCSQEVDNDGEGKSLRPRQICNAAFQILYRERDDITDQSDYFLQIDFPGKVPTRKARFSAASCSASSEFKKRLLAWGGLWQGTGEQLDRIMSAQPNIHTEVKPLHFTGYSADDRAWILGELAVREGRVFKINAEKYFDFGKTRVKLKTEERILDINWNADALDTSWLDPFWIATGPKGLITLSFFMLSLFAVQIRRGPHGSLGFLEITGEPGSGKTMLIEFLWKLLGRARYEGFDPNKQTASALGRNFMKVSGLPIGLIESGRNDDQSSHQRKFDYNELLTLYNGRNPRGLGVKSSGMETFEPEFLGSIYLMQNERIEAIDAVLERLMSMRIDKGTWTSASREAAQKIKSWPMESVSGTIVHILRQEAKWIEGFYRLYLEHREAMPARVAEHSGKRHELHNDRVILNHSQLAASVQLLPMLFPGIRGEWIAEAIAEIDAMALDRQNASSADHPVVQRFWEQFDYLISRESADQYERGNSLNKHRKPDMIALRLPEYEARARNAGLTPPPPDELRKYLKTSRVRKYLGQGSVRPPGGDDSPTAQCWKFQRPTAAATPSPRNRII